MASNFFLTIVEPQLVTRSAKIHYVRAPKLPINCAENMSEICLISVGGSYKINIMYVINEVYRPLKKQTIGLNPGNLSSLEKEFSVFSSWLYCKWIPCLVLYMETFKNCY